MEITLAERHRAAFWEERDKTALQGWDGSAGAEQPGCGLTWRLHITLFFPRTQEMEGFPVHTEPCVADESLWSGVSVTQAADSGLSTNSCSKPKCADVGMPSLPWDTENQLGGRVCHGACRETLWCRRCGLCSVGNSCTVYKPGWAPAPTFPTTPSVISLHPQQLPFDMLMHLRLHNLPAWLWGKGGISLCLANPQQAGRRPGAHHGPLLFRSAMWRRHLKAVLASLRSLLPGWRAQPETGPSLHKPEPVRHTAENKITCASVKWQCDTD